MRIGLLLAPAMLVVAVFFGAGVVQAVAQSLGYLPFRSGSSSLSSSSSSSLSLDAYRALWTDPAVRASLWLTLRVALLPTLLAAALGVGAALLIRALGRSWSWVTGLLQATLAVPHLVGALCMLLLLSQGGLLSRLGVALGVTDGPADFPALTNDTFGWGIIAEYVWKETPFLTLVALSALHRGVDDLADAARMLGAGPWQRFRHVLLPVLTPSVGGGAVLVFAFAAGSYEVPYLLGQPYPATLPVVALQYYRDTDLTMRPQAMAVAVLIAALSLLLVAGYAAVAGRLARRPL